MSASHLFRLGKLKGNNGILIALNHNKRVPSIERGAPANIDTTRTPLNYALCGDDTPKNISTEAKVLMLEAGIETHRKNGVMGVEIIFSLPIDRHKQDTRPFFEDCLAWTRQTFEGELLSFDVHLDESAPHAHAIILPLVDGKMKGWEMVGGTGNLYRLIDLFHKDVGSLYGLSRNEKKRISQNDKQQAIKDILFKLKGDPVMKSVTWPIVRDSIQKDPMLYAQLMGISIKQTTQKTFVGIMTKKVRADELKT